MERIKLASLLLARGVPARTVMEILEHSEINLTLDTYSHVLPSMQESAKDKLEEMLYKNSLQTQCRQ